MERDPTRAGDITDALVGGGWADVTVVAGAAEIGRAVAAMEADIVLIVIAHPDCATERLCLGRAAKKRIKPVLQIAIGRFDQMKKIQSELDFAKQALADRKVIDPALLIIAQDLNFAAQEGLDLKLVRQPT